MLLMDCQSHQQFIVVKCKRQLTRSVNASNKMPFISFHFIFLYVFVCFFFVFILSTYSQSFLFSSFFCCCPLSLFICFIFIYFIHRLPLLYLFFYQFVTRNDSAACEYLSFISVFIVIHVKMHNNHRTKHTNIRLHPYS